MFVEVQFGNSATLYREYYKFHYGLMHCLLSLAVLIVPTTPTAFFPTRPDSIVNMAEYVGSRCHARGAWVREAKKGTVLSACEINFLSMPGACKPAFSAAGT